MLMITLTRSWITLTRLEVELSTFVGFKDCFPGYFEGLNYTFTNVAAAPESGSLVLLGLTFAGIGVARRQIELTTQGMKKNIGRDKKFTDSTRGALCFLLVISDMNRGLFASPHSKTSATWP